MKTIGRKSSKALFQKLWVMKLGFVRDSNSHPCLGKIEALLVPVASLLKSVLKLHASTRDDNTRIRDLGSIRGNRTLRIGAAGLGLRLECGGSGHQEEQRCAWEPLNAEDHSQLS
jgi:hypothetical protein